MAVTDHVAIALDFSKPSEQAARAAFELAALTGAKKLTVLHATRDVVLPAGDTPELRQQLEALRFKLTAAAEQQLEALCQRVSSRSCERVVVRGRPSEAIPQALQSMGATLLVLGTHARKGLRRVFVGSIAEDLLRGLEIPALVTLVGADEVPPDEELRSLRHVVVGIDLTDEAEAIADAVVSLFGGAASERPLSIHLVHSLDTREELEALMREEREAHQSENRLVAEHIQKVEKERATALFERLEPKIQRAGFEVTRHMGEGDFVETAAELIESLPAQLVVVGTHGRHRAPILELGSTASRMIRASAVSVLIVPSHAPESGDASDAG